MNKSKETYRVVVETGSCSENFTQWEERYNCGHNHKTFQAAVRCLLKLTKKFCDPDRPMNSWCSRCHGPSRGNRTSAKWYGARIHNQNQERIQA